MIRAFIFDMDGLLVETESIHMRAFEQWLGSKGIKPPAGYTKRLVGASIADNIAMLQRDLGLAGDARSLARERNDVYLRMLAASEIKPLPGVRELLAFAEERGLLKAVCSSSDREQLDIVLPRVLASLGKDATPQEYFDAVVSGEGMKHLKPAPDIYLSCAAALDAAPRQCLAFEDSLAGARSAAAAGMAVIAAPNPFSSGVTEWPTRYVVKTLEEVLPKGLVEAGPDGEVLIGRRA